MENEQSELLKMQEALFCAQFELNALANLTVRGEAERWVPGYLWNNYENEHRLRYTLALQYVKGKTVLDIACGSGYGAYLIASKGEASEVIGCDLDEDAVRYGTAKFPHDAVSRVVANAQEFEKADYFDVAISFETIEHLSDYAKFLNNIYRSLKKDGLFVVSTPVVERTQSDCANPYHTIEWAFSDFQRLIKTHFAIESIYVQSIELKKRKKSKISRILQRLRSLAAEGILKETPDVNPQLFTGQYPIDCIVGGYQIVVCRKK